MLEMLGGQRKAPEVLVGDSQLGYYGFVKSSDFINTTTLHTTLAIRDGSIITAHNDAGWLKFAYKGKILYIAKKPLMNNMSWYQLYRNGLVFGDDGYGPHYIGGPVPQDRRVTIRGKVYRVRLMRIMPNFINSQDTSGREHKDLWTRVMKDVPEGELPRWASYTPEELGGAGMEDGALTWSTDMVSSSPEFIGTYGGGFLTRQLQHFGTFNYYNGWRPVLELDA